MKSKSPSAVVDKLVSNFLTNKPKKPLIVILGPTASGKTALALQLAKKYNGEIISADSRQIYCECDRGTAKPTATELRAIPHHLVSVFPPNKTINVITYRRLAEQKIREIRKRGKLPILAGSHTLLLSAIIENYRFPKTKPNLKRRKELKEAYDDKNGPEKLWRLLNELDQAVAKKIPPTNRYHLIRTLELAEQVGKTSHVKQKGRRKYNTILLGLNPARADLYEKINVRTDRMMRAGLLAEVKKLAKKYDRYAPALRSHGYRELLDYLNNEKSLEQAVTEIKQDTRNYAKRQMTWWRNSDLSGEINWLD